MAGCSWALGFVLRRRWSDLHPLGQRRRASEADGSTVFCHLLGVLGRQSDWSLGPGCLRLAIPSRPNAVTRVVPSAYADRAHLLWRRLDLCGHRRDDQPRVERDHVAGWIDPHRLLPSAHYLLSPLGMHDPKKDCARIAGPAFAAARRVKIDDCPRPKTQRRVSPKFPARTAGLGGVSATP